MSNKLVQSKLIRFYLKSELVLFAMVVLTVAAIPLKSVLKEQKPIHVYTELSDIVDDASRKGISEGRFLGEDKMSFVCTLKKGKYNHPFCGYRMRLAKRIYEGINMAKYDSLVLDIDYVGDAKSVRLYLRNFNPKYSSKKEQTSTKYLITEFESELLNDRFEIPLQNFKVADWWVAKNNIPYALSQSELSNVPIMQIQTGTKAPLGDHKFTINALYLKRQIVSDEKFYLGLVVIWIVTILSFLASRLYVQNVEILRQRFNTKVLEKEKEVLDRIAENFEKKSKTDPLTKALNREGMDDHIERAWFNYRNSNTNFCFILFDIDHFKIINDEHGHDAGDLILSELSALVHDNKRASDVFARWGGEEFLILCLDTDKHNTVKFADKLRKTISEHTFSNGLHATCSFGVACIAEAEDPVALYKVADDALYLAKKSGRNTVRS